MTAPACDVCGWTPKARRSIRTALAIHAWRIHGTTLAGAEAPCTHNRVHHDHGHPQRYIGDGCRCTLCIEGHRAYKGQRAKARAYGRFDGCLVDATPVVEHIAALRAQDMPTWLIAERAGVGYGAVRELMSSRGQGPRPITGEPVRVHAYIADAVLAVTAEPHTHRKYAPAVGATRRLRALLCLGYGMEELARRTGMNIKSVRWAIRGETRYVSRRNAAAVGAVFDQLWDKPVTEYPDKWAKASATRARREAARAGYHPPLAWDNIDDPDEEPTGARAPEGKQHEAEAFIEDLDWLRRTGTNPTEAAHRLGTTIHAIEQAARRHGRRDLANWAGTAIRAQRKAA